ncbi:MAG TPA: efflux RND transporter periplasmic adaptor subunit [Bryobacteraceae bacterium]|nr:efflux RND transporter periplasmic adaptor subunit [Bryobacteraceae bacterium]
MEAELKSLRIDRSRRKAPARSKWPSRWIGGGVALFLLLGAGRYAYQKVDAAPAVEVMRVKAAVSPSASGGSVILNATGYIIAAHRIQVASKVVGKVSWIGVEKGDRVREGQVLVRLEDDEYRAQLQQANGQLANLQARLKELQNGSRPEEIAAAMANLNVAKADLANAGVSLRRTKELADSKVLARQVLDDAQARYDSAQAKVASLEKTYELVKLGPRVEQIEAVSGQIEQAKGLVAFYQTQLNNTVIKAPVSGTILERAVEKGEFVTTSFVGDKGAKGYVVSLANLNDLQVELDISQSDFAKLGPRQPGVVTTDAFPDRKYEGFIEEISPEANRQKATVQVKVRVNKPDGFLRPEMNANVAFVSDAKPAGSASTKPVIVVPASAVRDGAVFVTLGGKAIRRPVKTGPSGSRGARIDEGLIGGEDLIVNPPADLKDGDKVAVK